MSRGPCSRPPLRQRCSAGRGRACPGGGPSGGGGFVSSALTLWLQPRANCPAIEHGPTTWCARCICNCGICATFRSPFTMLLHESKLTNKFEDTTRAWLFFLITLSCFRNWAAPGPPVVFRSMGPPGPWGCRPPPRGRWPPLVIPGSRPFD